MKAMMGAALACAAMASVPAEARTFDFTYSAQLGNGDAFTGRGVFTVNEADVTPGTDVLYRISDASGTADLARGGYSTTIAGVDPSNSFIQRFGDSYTLASLFLAFDGYPQFFNLFLASGNNIAGSSIDFVPVAATFAIVPGDDAVAAVPEPASWALMIGGVGLVGGAMRRRRATVRVAFA